MVVQTIARPKPTPAPQISIPPLITGEALFVMGDIGPCELVKGEIIRHMPTGHPHAQQVLTWRIDEISKVVDDLSHEFNLDFRHSLGMELDSRLVVVKKVNRTGWSLMRVLPQ